MNPSRTPYPTDVSDDEWAFVAPYLTLLPEEAGQRSYSLREVFNGLRLPRTRRRAVAPDAQ
jgi:transposase